ncbi:methyltransferase OMS1 [Colletotrichum plurivorum]|uniref:Methyltransferase OMS1 n=1 Tax=Colletotrichum plurivorum TaxID=2175906 RepID=A0A8H6MSH3_9PEZI|nr:methyltransferase OMS1 [Colletotrichum plurivorum]
MLRKITPSRIPPTRPPPATRLETADAIFKARKIPLLASGVVALGLGIYLSLLASSLASSSCCENSELAPDATGKVQPAVFTKESARRFDQNLDGPEWLMGITSLRQKLAAESSGHVLEVAMGTGRNLSFYNWSQIRSSKSAPVPAVPLSPSPASKSSALLSFTGVDISGEMLGVAIEKLPQHIPECKNATPELQTSKSGLPVEWDAVSYFSGRLRLFRSDILDFIPPPAKQASSSTPKYDTVVQTFGLCSVRDPEDVVRKLAGMVKPDTGRIILLEHGRGWCGVVNGLLDKSAASHFKRYGCWWNRDIAEIVQNVARSTPGIEVVKTERPYLTQLGTTLWVELRVTHSGEGGEATAG